MNYNFDLELSFDKRPIHHKKPLFFLELHTEHLTDKDLLSYQSILHSVDSIHSDSIPNSFCSCSSFFANIKQLCLRSNFFLLQPFYFSTLTELRLKCSANLTELALKCPNLKRLECQGCKIIDNKDSTNSQEVCCCFYNLESASISYESYSCFSQFLSKVYLPKLFELSFHIDETLGGDCCDLIALIQRKSKTRLERIKRINFTDTFNFNKPCLPTAFLSCLEKLIKNWDLSFIGPLQNISGDAISVTELDQFVTKLSKQRCTIELKGKLHHTFFNISKPLTKGREFHPQRVANKRRTIQDEDKWWENQLQHEEIYNEQEKQEQPFGRKRRKSEEKTKKTSVCSNSHSCTTYERGLSISSCFESCAFIQEDQEQKNRNEKLSIHEKQDQNELENEKCQAEKMKKKGLTPKKISDLQYNESKGMSINHCEEDSNKEEEEEEIKFEWRWRQEGTLDIYQKQISHVKQNQEEKAESNDDDMEAEYDLNWYWDYDKNDWVRCDPSEWEDCQETKCEKAKEFKDWNLSLDDRKKKLLLEEGEKKSDNQKYVERNRRHSEIERLMKERRHRLKLI